MGRRKRVVKKTQAGKPVRVATANKGEANVRHYFSEQHMQETVWPGFQRLYEEEQLFDIILVAEGQSVRAHRCYLASCSQYFCSMFTGGFSESKVEEVSMEAVTALGLRTAVEFMYTAKVKLHPDNIATVLEAASHLQLWTLQKLCEQYMTEDLTIDNCLQFFHLAEIYSLENSKEAIRNYMLSKFVVLGQRREFLALSKRAFCELLSSDHLDAESELQVFDIAVQWLKHEPDRKAFVSTVLSHVRFGLMTSKEMEVVHTNPFRDEKMLPQFLSVLQKATKYHMNLFAQPFMDTRMAQPRMYIESLAIFGGRSPRIDVVSDNILASALLTCEVVRFEAIAKLQTPIYNTQVAVLNNFVYLVGGETQFDARAKYVTNAAFRYNPRDGKWLPLASMKKPRTRFAIAVIDNWLVALGGITDSFLRTSAVERYDLKENEWSEIPCLPHDLTGHAACEVNRKIYVSGGFSSSPRNDLWQYDLSDKEWVQKNPMIEKRSFHSMVQCRDKLIVCSGATKTDRWTDVMQTEIYDIRTDQWSLLSPVLQGTAWAGAVCSGNYLFILGGVSHLTSKTLSTIQRYDINNDEWRVLDTVLPKPMELAAVKVIQLPQRFYQDNYDSLKGGLLPTA